MIKIRAEFARKSIWHFRAHLYLGLSLGFIVLNLLSPVYAKEPLIAAAALDAIHFKDYSIEKFRCAFEYAGYEFKLIELPPERAFISIQRGTIDVDLFRLEESLVSVKNIVTIPTPVFYIEKWIYIRKDFVDFDISRIKEHKLIPIHGVQYYQTLKTKGFSMSDYAPSLYSAFKMLEAGRGDYLIWTQDGKSIISNHEFDDKLKAIQYEKSKPLFTVLHKKHSNKLIKLDKAYQRVFVNGECDDRK